jgi:hypothetical protein
MRWLKALAIGFGALLGLLVAVPFLVPLEHYLPAIERQVSERLGERVKIGALRATLLPVPQLAVREIEAGERGDIRVSKVIVTPDFWSLLGSPKVIRSVEIEGLEATPGALGRLASRKPAADRGEVRAVVVQSVRLTSARLRLERAALGPFDAEIALAADGAFSSATLRTADGKLVAEVRPAQGGFFVEARARGWTLPAGPPIVFDELRLKGIAHAEEASFKEIHAKLYGGNVNGQARLRWRKGIELSGSAAVNGVELRSLAPLIAQHARVSGRLTARPVFRAFAAEAAQLASALRLETPFEVQDGVLYGVDIGRAASLIASRQENSPGGQTRFDELSGHLVLERRAYRFTKLKIASGALAADGHVSVSPEQELSGRIHAKIKAASVTAATVPLNVSGTVQAPVLLPTAGYVAGAAAGTAILGPGLGTTIGATISTTLGRLFGGESAEEKKAPER